MFSTITKNSHTSITNTKIISKEAYNSITKCTGNSSKMVCASEVFDSPESAYRANKEKDEAAARIVYPKIRITIKDKTIKTEK